MSVLNQAERDKLPESKFADSKNRKFPVLDCSDFEDAWGLAGHAEHPDAVRARVLEMGAKLGCDKTDAMKEWESSKSQNANSQNPLADEQRATLAASGAVAAHGEFEVLPITEGEAKGHGWLFSREVLQASLLLLDGVECFVDHTATGRHSLRDLGGVFHSTQWSDAHGGPLSRLRPSGPSGDLVAALGREMLSESEPKPRVGFSADVGFLAEGKQVKKILRYFSVDLVFDPARGGAFVRALNSIQPPPRGKEANMGDESKEKSAPAPAEKKEGGGGVVAQLQADLEAIRTMTAVAEEKRKLSAEAEAAHRAAMCGHLLDSGLAASKLPAPMQEHVRKQFAGKVFDPVELTAVIDDSRKLAASLVGGQAVAGITHVSAMFSTEDQLQAAVDDLLEAPRDEAAKGVQVHRLMGIRELYHMLTGDYDYHGGYYADRVRLATTSDFSGLVKNALNKIVVNQWGKLGRAGYDWWERIVITEHFNSLQSVTGTLVGTVGALPSVAEQGEYTELVIGDSPETASFTKYGGYIPLTLELIDRDETRKLKQYPRELANGALRRISALVAAIFTDNAGIGPTLADTGALFNNTAVTTAGGHANLRTTALSSAEWETVKSAIYKQPQLIKNATGLYGTGPRMAVNPKFLLVPRDLELTGRQILYPNWERAANIFTENQQQGQPGDVITVPDWTDTNDFAAVCDPTIAPAIYVGERFGLLPEIFLAGDEQSPAVFMNDEHRLKVRIFLAVWVNDFRPLAKNNVA